MRAYHRCIETIVREWASDGDLRQVLTMPEPLRRELERHEESGVQRVHLCRLDLLPSLDGGFKVLETNANCPGGLLYSGRASRAWRDVLLSAGAKLPDPMAHEDPHWMGRWFLEVALKDTGAVPARVALLRKEGGNRLELAAFAAVFRELGVESWEADPAECSRSGSGGLTVGGRATAHAYLKLGIQDFLGMRGRVGPFLDAVSSGELFVQNGLGGRWVGDNKLCLAVLSDPAFQHHFARADLDELRGRIPWSRNLALCGGEVLSRIRANPGEYVLKSPLDTRGRGVIVGREVSGSADWGRRVTDAAVNGWLVQEFCEAPEVETDFGSTETHKHDLALGAINGELQGAFMRSSSELRVNVARAGRMHPVFVG
ncbi:MAG: hypothetical protein HKO53_05640 [Gemmatimonadetes bacterium]|nr:hypothetical protein [Gemmatimonadota bacterium]